MLGQRCSPLLDQCRSIVYDADPTLIYHRVCCILWQTRGIRPMLFQCWPTVFDAGPSLKQHWVIVPCFLTAALCWWRFNIPAPETPDSTINWPNADVCDAGPTLFQPKPFKLLTTNIIVNIYIFWTLVKDKSTEPKDLERYIVHVHKNWCTEMWTVSHTQYPSFPRIGHKLRINLIGYQP